MDEGAGQSLEFFFREWEWNPPLDKALFVFSPPPGVAIVDGLLPEVSRYPSKVGWAIWGTQPRAVDANRIPY